MSQNSLQKFYDIVCFVLGAGLALGMVGGFNRLYAILRSLVG